MPLHSTALSDNTATEDQPQHISQAECQDDMKAITALSVVLKSQSVKVLGLQLLIGMMLVGRATSRRVRYLYMMYIYQPLEYYKLNA